LACTNVTLTTANTTAWSTEITVIDGASPATRGRRFDRDELTRWGTVCPTCRSELPTSSRCDTC